MRLLSLSLLSLFFVGLLVLGHPERADAEEQRCIDLGSACVCSEPLDVSSLGPIVSSWYYNPSDSTTKECTRTPNNSGAVLESNYPASRMRTIDSTSEPLAFSSLPSGNTLSNVVAGADGHTGIFLIGHKTLGGGNFVKRAAFRFYVYYSPDYVFDQGACNNSKFGGLPGLTSVDGTHGNPHITAMSSYKFNNNTQSGTDCCYDGPPAQPGLREFNVNQGNKFPGKWWRVETITQNRAGGASPNGLVWIMYIKNVTDNTPEIVVINSGCNFNNLSDPEACSAGPQGTWLNYDDLTPGNGLPVDEFRVNAYRQGTCTGFRAVSHLLLAGWNTDTGQRIGSALEIEGVAGQIDPNLSGPVMINRSTRRGVRSGRRGVR